MGLSSALRSIRDKSHWEYFVSDCFRLVCLRSCAVLCLVAQSCLTLCSPMDCSPPNSSEQEYWNGLPYLPPGNLPNWGIEPRSPALQADSLPTEPLGKPQAGNGLPSNHCCMPTMCLPEEFAAFPSRLISFNFSASSISSPSQKQPWIKISTGIS